jgi:hypothetical protein
MLGITELTKLLQINIVLRVKIPNLPHQPPFLRPIAPTHPAQPRRVLAPPTRPSHAPRRRRIPRRARIRQRVLSLGTATTGTKQASAAVVLGNSAGLKSTTRYTLRQVPLKLIHRYSGVQLKVTGRRAKDRPVIRPKLSLTL